MFLPLVAPPSPFVEKPWVQLGEQREVGSLAVVWQTPDDDAGMTLEYTSGGKTRTAASTSRRVALEGVAPHWVVTASLTGLKAGELVRYRVRRGKEEVFAASAVAPKRAGQPFSFVVFGDCGNGSKPQAQIAGVAYGERPDFVMITGDIVYSDGQASEYRTNFFPQFNADERSEAGAPLLRSTLVAGVPGNHDIAHTDLDKYPDGLAYYAYWRQPLNGPIGDPANPSATPAKGSPERMTAFRAAAGANFPRMANYSFDYGDAHWTCLDANPYVDWTDPALRKWVADDLASAKGKAWRFVAFHQPPFHSSRAHQKEKQMRLAADLFEDGRVDVVFSGHVHNYQRTFPIRVGAKRGAGKDELAKDDWPVDRLFNGVTVTRPKGVLYIVDGAGGAGLYDPQLADDAGKWNPFQAQYIADFSLSSVRVDGRRLVLRQLDLNGKERDRFTIEK